MDVEHIVFLELNHDQSRERVNTEQRFAGWREAKARADGYRGSLTWHGTEAAKYLTRSYYDSAGIRRQKIEGRRGPDTEALKTGWDAARGASQARQKQLREGLVRQAAVNRALGLGRIPLVGARIIRAIDEAGLLGRGLRVIGTNALYAYEATAGIMVDPGITSTLDIDLLMDARRSLRIVAGSDVPEGSLIGLLRRVDTSFARTGATFRALNRDGYLVDLIKPEPRPPWTKERITIGAAKDDLAAVSIDGLAWHESAPPFEAVAIDERGGPVRIVATDPRVFAAHKLWMSRQASREPTKRRRDAAQAQAVARLTVRYLPHLPFEADALRMLPRAVFDAAAPLFVPDAQADELSF